MSFTGCRDLPLPTLEAEVHALTALTGQVDRSGVAWKAASYTRIGEPLCPRFFHDGLVGSESATAGGLLLGGALRFVAASVMRRVADQGYHMARRVFENTDKYADAVVRAGGHTDSFLGYLLQMLDS